MPHSAAFLRIVLKNEHLAYNFHKIPYFLLQSAGPETLHTIYQGDSTCSGFLQKWATKYDHLDPIRNIRNAQKTPGRVISEEMAVLMGLLLGYQGDTTFSGFLVTRVTNWDLMDPIRNIRNVQKTPGWVILEETAVLIGLLLGYQGDTAFSGFLMARVANWDLMDPIRNIRNVKKTPGWVILE